MAVTRRVQERFEELGGTIAFTTAPGRDFEVLRLMAGGYSNREIAELGAAEGTIKNHASSILSKLGGRDRTRAVLKALELGYMRHLAGDGEI